MQQCVHRSLNKLTHRRCFAPVMFSGVEHQDAHEFLHFVLSELAEAIRNDRKTELADEGAVHSLIVLFPPV